MKKYIFFALLLAYSLVACNKKSIVQQSDIAPFLNNKTVQKKLNQKLGNNFFWQQKLMIDNNYVNLLQLAYSNIDLFGQTGNAQHLQQADSFFIQASKKVQGKESTIYIALAQNAITQHQFKKAKAYLDSANTLSAQPYQISLVSFDINMEVGDYTQAAIELSKIKNTKNQFDYLIRLAKYQDYLGNIENAVAAMEKALQLSKTKNNKAQQLWLITNIADMYTHENKLEKAYNLYLQSLALDSSNVYALQQIANISNNEDNNKMLCNEIWKFIESQKNEPSIILAKAKNENDNNLLNEFINTTSSSVYGNMYNTYNIDLYLNQTNNFEKGLQLSIAELQNRATPSSYSWLALAYYKNNDREKAEQLINEKVLDKTHEPLALYNAAIVLRNSNSKVYKKLLEQCNQSKYELGHQKIAFLNAL
jgi:Flp pilus assembly protein TadD